MSIIDLASPHPLFPDNGDFLGLYLTNTPVGRGGGRGRCYSSRFKIHVLGGGRGRCYCSRFKIHVLGGGRGRCYCSRFKIHVLGGGRGRCYCSRFKILSILLMIVLGIGHEWFFLVGGGGSDGAVMIVSDNFTRLRFAHIKQLRHRHHSDVCNPFCLSHCPSKRSKVPPIKVTVTVTESLGVNESLVLSHCYGN